MNPLYQVLVYGTLKPGERYHDRYCGSRCQAAEAALVYGTLFALPIGYPALVVGDRSPAQPVYGYVLSFIDPQVLPALDGLENYQPHRPPTENEYQRQTIATFRLNHEPLGTAWVYVMDWEQVQRRGGVWLPEGRWPDPLQEPKPLPDR